MKYFCCPFVFLTVLKLAYKENEAKDTTPFCWYGVCATTYLGAMLASNKALQWVNYPTQVIVNC